MLLLVVANREVVIALASGEVVFTTRSRAAQLVVKRKVSEVCWCLGAIFLLSKIINHNQPTWKRGRGNG